MIMRPHVRPSTFPPHCCASAAGALAVSACAYEGLEDTFLVGFTNPEVDALTSLVEDLLVSNDAAANTTALLSHFSPELQALHAHCVATGGQDAS